MHRFPYRWTLKGAEFSKDKGKVFSCFAGGGGSTMGYKLAGFDVIGCNEIDPRMLKVYVANHHPRYNFLESIQTFKLRKDLPEELYKLDILDGSPPCSSFSSCGNRENDWGKEKKFREGQTSQVLDTLFFDLIDLAGELQPKVVIAENVKGLLLGNAKAYVTRIYHEFDAAGYVVCHHLLNGSAMGVPQRRERVFFTAIRKDLLRYIPRTATLFEDLPYIDMTFKEPEIHVGDFADFKGDEVKGEKYRLLWENRKYGDCYQSQANERLYGESSHFGQSYIYLERVCPTLTAHRDCVIHYEQPRFVSVSEVCCISSFPQDFNYLDVQPWYVCGMSVPPVMMAQVAARVYEQWLSNIPL